MENTIDPQVSKNNFPADTNPSVPAIPELPETNESPMRESSKKRFNWVKALPLVITVIISLVIGFWLIPNSNIAPTIKKILSLPAKEPEEEEIIVIDQEEEEEERRIVFIVPGEERSSNASIYLKNLKTYEQSLVHTINDYDSTHLQPYVQMNGDLYVVRFSEEQGGSRIHSLWIYRKDGSYEEIYLGSDLNYSIAPNGVYVGVISENVLSIINISKESEVKEQKFKELTAQNDEVTSFGTVSVYGWSSDSKYVWGYTANDLFPYSLFKIDVESGEVETFDVYALSMQLGEMALNTDYGFLAFSDYPPIFDVYEIKEFKLSEEKVTLYLYNLFDEKDPRIFSSSKGVPFKPEWIDSQTLEYDSPAGKGRVQAKPELK